jgi:diguanylate cyclase (GGDEF)-like protein
MITDKFEISKKDILIIDDTPDNLRVLSAMLTKQGYNVRKALNWQMALTACQTVLPDLILLDIMMPEVDGYEVCQRLKADNQTNKIPVIFISALDDVFDKVKAFRAGGVDYITKPFEFEEVLVRVQNQLALRAAELKNEQINAELEDRVQERTNQLQMANQELIKEIVERKQLQNKLLHMALHDPLTELPNRSLLIERLEKSLLRAQEDSNYQFAVLFLDCDRFKIVNDSLGHLVGDELLIAIGCRLQEAITHIDMLARLGGDEFVILLEEISDISIAIQVAKKILSQLSIPFQLSRHEVFINASIGIAMGNVTYEKPEYILRDADTAMYRAKALGKARYHVFDPDMHQHAVQLLQLENDLRRAIERHELVIYYQPIICLKTNKIAGFEALVRWQHPHRGLVPPGDFIPVAEETGLISAINTLVLQEACYQLSLWQSIPGSNPFISVNLNLSTRLFSHRKLIDKLDQILQETHLDPAKLKLEITESTIMENSESDTTILQQLKQRKVNLIIDDFGTGYSSLSYLHSFPVNALKIDQSFIRRMHENIENMGLVPAIIGIAHSMGMNVIAEGVETPEQLAKLRSLGCDFAQGFLFSKPVPHKLALDLLVSPPHW